ncbi:hypothetical protein PSSHI_04870 [Photobacterium sp. R1]
MIFRRLLKWHDEKILNDWQRTSKKQCLFLITITALVYSLVILFLNSRLEVSLMTFALGLVFGANFEKLIQLRMREKIKN